MTHVRMTKSQNKAPAPPARKPRKTEMAFDLWLHKNLHQLFDEVAREPIPEELLRLIQENKEK
jgi:hypothetical protein